MDLEFLSNEEIEIIKKYDSGRSKVIEDLKVKEITYTAFNTCDMEHFGMTPFEVKMFGEEYSFIVIITIWLNSFQTLSQVDKARFLLHVSSENFMDKNIGHLEIIQNDLLKNLCLLKLKLRSYHMNSFY